MMAQGLLPFKYQAETRASGVTALAGLPVYLDLAHLLGLTRSIAEHVGARRSSQGWTDTQMVMSLILLNLAGGDCVDDLRILESDEGFARVLQRVELGQLSRRERREFERRWRKERRRTVPSPSAVFRYLRGFHDAEQEKLRVAHKAFIPAATEHLLGLEKVNQDLLAAVQRRSPSEIATLDMDATLVESFKRGALHCYKGFKSYQPLNVWWAEQGLVVRSEFRDGNVPAGFEQLRLLKEAEAALPASVKRVRVRSDSAGYQEELLRYCEEGRSERFGRIEFAVSSDVTPEFKKAVAEVPEKAWQAIHWVDDKGRRYETGQQWTEVCFVPNSLSRTTKGDYRFLAVREPLEQQPLPGMGEQLALPFPTMELGATRFKLFGIVTNLTCCGEAVVTWLRGRCGKSEEVHAIMKSDLAGGQLPSGRFGANAAWWAIMILALNLSAAMKRLVMSTIPGQAKVWVVSRMKALRFGLIHIPGFVMQHARQLWIRVAGSHPGFEVLLQIRQRIALLAAGPAG